ncbi:cyclic nucleotide-binding protein [Ectothiorhodospiraceae bacterium BW-2]|nr:cyclic nucleotide-binding protein [Ectothiorhodospiraceae bacterium BW-2]
MALETRFLRQFVPLNELTEENLRDLAQKSAIQTIEADTPLFKRGQSDRKSIYILSGQVLLLAEDGGKEIVTGGTSRTRLPIDQHTPRKTTAIAKTEVRYLAIDSDYLDLLLSWEQSQSSYQVEDIDSNHEEDDDDWMANLLQSEIFHRIPASNIQMVFMRMEPINYSAGEVVINQGDEGDYYYYIKRGSCEVTIRGKSGKNIKVAELQAGRGFGEEALISNNKRNATVSMKTDGILMRLGKEDFAELLKDPVLHKMDFNSARQLLQQGSAQLVDVRLESEYKQFNLKGSLNIPLYLLRLKTSELDNGKQIITLCDNGKRSSSAAFLLNERGFNASYIDGGLLRIKEIIQQSRAQS